MRFRFGTIQLDDAQFTLSGPDGPIHVEPQVFAVLQHLVVHRDRVVAKEELLDEIWGDRFVSESALTSRVKAARRAVGDDGTEQRVIRTIHSRGYQFVADVHVDPGGTRGLPRLRHAVIGRDADLAQVADRVREAALVTVTGPGGIGKTTVALAVAERLRGEFPDGVVFVDLSSVGAGGDITRAVTDAAGIEGGSAESLDRVADLLARRPMLLVLDNCEHVLDRSVALVDHLLASEGPARVLATSREPLAVAGEHVWPLGPLHDDGAELFVERARAAEPRVAWDVTDPAVLELCRLVDDVPLALELAAGQLRRFDLDELNHRLRDRLALLSRRASGERHATMATAIDWSYQLLDAAEQALLRQLSAFPATFDVATVEATAPEATGPSALAVLGRLVDKSLVVRLPGTGRYRLLETIRVFARDRLDETGETAAAFERQRRHVVAKAVARSRLDRWMSARLAATTRADMDNVRLAFRSSLDRGAIDDAVEIAVRGSFLWRNAIGCAEADSWLDELSQRELSADDGAWLELLRADVAQGRGDPRRMFGSGEGAHELATAAGDGVAACLGAHFAALVSLTDPESAKARLAPALELARGSGDERLVVLIEAFLAVADLGAGHHDDVRAALVHLEHDASEDGYDRFIVHWLGWMLGLAERDVVAREWMGRQQSFLDRTGIVETWITSFSTAMGLAIDGGVPEMLAHTLDLAAREGYRAEADCLLVVAYAEVGAGRIETAAELVGAAMHGRFNATAHYVLYRAVLDPLIRAGSESEEVAAAVERGRGRAPERALAEWGITASAEL